MDFDFSFTEHDTPEIRERIEHDLAQIVRGVRANDRRVVALALTGGFARGEGTVRGDAPVNDYDLVAVRSVPGGRALHAKLGRALGARVGIEVDLMPVWSARLPHVAPKLFWLDLRLGGRVIAGDVDALARLPSHRPSDLPRREVARLLGNRAAGLLRAVPGAGEPRDELDEALQAAKAVIAAMDARLLARHEYAPRLRERLALAADLPEAPVFAAAVSWKLDGVGRVDWREARDVLLSAVRDLRAREQADGLAEHAYHLLAGRRWRASPSRALRCATWDILGLTESPGGPVDPERARRSLAPFGRVDTLAWPRMKERYFRLRAQTLQ